jgi:hypothetical protein
MSPLTVTHRLGGTIEMRGSEHVARRSSLISPGSSPLAGRLPLIYDDADETHARFLADQRDGRRRAGLFFASLVVLAGVAVVFLLVLTGNQALLDEHLDAALALVAGGTGGYGLGKSREA